MISHLIRTSVSSTAVSSVSFCFVTSFVTSTNSAAIPTSIPTPIAQRWIQPKAGTSISRASGFSAIAVGFLTGVSTLGWMGLMSCPAFAEYQPPRRETPLRTESAGVRLSEEICSDRALYKLEQTVTLTHQLLKMTDQIRTLVPPSMQSSSGALLRERC